MSYIKNLTIIFSLVALTACGTTDQVPLTYKPSQSAAKYKPLAVVGEVKDSRKYPGTALGGVRNGFGAKRWILELEKPASEVVRDAVTAGIKSRGMLAAGSPKYAINIDIIKLDCNKYARREAHAEWVVNMVEKTSGQNIYAKTIIVNKENGGTWEINRASTEVNNLKELSNQALQEAVDQLLNDPGFVAKFN